MLSYEYLLICLSFPGLKADRQNHIENFKEHLSRSLSREIDPTLDEEQINGRICGLPDKHIPHPESWDYRTRSRNFGFQLLLSWRIVVVIIHCIHC